MNAEQWKSRRSAALAWQRSRPDDEGPVTVVGADDDAAEGFAYRAGEVLCGSATIDLLRREVDAARADPRDDAVNHRLALGGVDLQRWRLPREVDAHRVQRRLDRPARLLGGCLELNHVFAGEWFYGGGPATAPEPAGPLPLRSVSTSSAPRSPWLAVLDTGVTDPAHAYFARELLGTVPPAVDLLDEDGDSLLDSEAGHGTFICGLVQRVAPGLATEQHKVLNASGFGDDLSVALGLAESTAPVVNLSLGGYTAGDRRPQALAQVLRALAPERVVVAAAGNGGRARPFWPAAFERVVAVAAFDSATGRRAPFSNHGAWVDVCAPGVDLHSSFVDGRHGPGADEAFTGWATWSGTSFAAPVVAAEIARRASLAPERSAADVAAAFLAELENCDDLGCGVRYAPAADLAAQRP